MNKRWTIEIVCTDRGQHKRTWMTRFIWEPAEGWRSLWLGPDRKHDMYGPPTKSHESYGFCCSRCKRWPRVEPSRWTKIMDAARNEAPPEPWRHRL
jgi:hypothetical protein